MSSEIKVCFDQHIPINITPALLRSVIHFVNAYETRGNHPSAFNSPYLGLVPCFFLTKDRDDFLNLFDSSERAVKQLIATLSDGHGRVGGAAIRLVVDELKNHWTSLFQRTTVAGVAARDIRHLIASMSSVPEHFKVASDPFNLFTTYLLHCIIREKNQTDLHTAAAFKVFMLLQYKFFTSLVNHRFPYKPDEGAMRAMFEQLTLKFDIKVYGTWKAVMEARAKDFLDKGSIHYEHMIQYTDDKRIIYFLSDAQTRIRNQINVVTQEFMRVKEEHDRIGTYSYVGSDIEGEKMLVDGSEMFDSMAANVYNDTLSISRLLDDSAIRLISNLFSNLLTTKFRAFLIGVSELATKQYRSGKSLEVKDENGVVIDIGLQQLIQDIVQKSYRYALNNKVKVSNPVMMLSAMKDVYSSSRISDPGIILVRESVSYLVDTLQVSQREATVASYRIAFILYVILITFRYRS